MSELTYREKCLSQKINACYTCGTDQNLYVHHIDGDQQNNALDNLIPLCPSCHNKVHRSYKYGKPFDSLTNKLPDTAIINGPYTAEWRDEFNGKQETVGRFVTTVRLRENGQVTIPIEIRESLELTQGDTLEIDVRSFNTKQT